jgi:hypothetical protein
MNVASDKDRIDYLILRRYPGARVLKNPPSLSSSHTHPDRRQIQANVAAYRAELSALPADQLRGLYDAEREKEAKALQQQAEQRERALPFNQPYAVADFDHWSRAAHWTLDEALALSFGKAPECVGWEKVKNYVNTSPFAFQYARRRDLVLRAVPWQQLFDPVLPGIFLAWCKRTGIDVPPALEAAVTIWGVRIADWRKLYEELQAETEKRESDWVALVRGRDELIARLKARIAELEVQPPKPQGDVGDKPLGTRERDSLLKLVIGLAVGGYGYDPKAARSEKPAEIASDLTANGLALDVDTVRKWLAQARELLPRDWGVYS